uniref:ABC transporter substrate-binding protein n=1 Tax=Magnetococcus massalia (strain MO-1) TaxID=451514 RepID=A0A1S7LM79_MAGMO|nr:Conserved exported protein of unknown function. ABC-type uncharacterized transport system periplasmic component-like protein (modular protein) [Candidatus Magnetococcus massalia]
MGAMGNQLSRVKAYRLGFYGVLSAWLLLCTLPSILLTSTAAASVTPPLPYRVLIIDDGRHLQGKKLIQNLTTHLAQLGFQQDKNLKLIHQLCKTSAAELSTTLLEQFEALQPQLVIANGTIAALQAKQLAATRNIPLLFMSVPAPVEAGLVQQTGLSTQGFITGRSDAVTPAIRLSMVHKLLRTSHGKGKIRLGLIHSHSPAALADLQQLKRAVQKFPQIELISHALPKQVSCADLPQFLAALQQAIKQLDGRIDYWWSSHGPMSQLAEVQALFTQHSDHIVVYGVNQKMVERGALLRISPDEAGMGREMAELTSAILHGTLPGHIPVAMPKEIALGFNLTTAEQIALVIPSELMELARGQLSHTVRR